MRAPKLSRLLGAMLLAALLLATPPAMAETLILRDFTLIDGTGKAPLGQAAMVIEDGRIRWVGPAARLEAPANAKTVRLPGKFVMPGLIDTHVHLGLTTDGYTVDAENQTMSNVEAQLRTYARYGVTTVQSQGTDQDIILRMRDAQRSTRPREARIYSAGLGIVAAGGYGGLAGVTKPVATPAEAEQAVDREARRHVDLIKFWLDSELGTMPLMPPDLSAATIEAAHAHKLRVVSHIFYLDDARRVLSQGVDGLTHAVRDQLVDQPLIEGMKRGKQWQMASTLAREQALFAYGARAPWLDDPFFRQAVPAATLTLLASPEHQAKIAAGAHFDELAGFLENAKRNLKRLADAGVLYAMGTDAGGPWRFPGHAEHAELELMVEAGLTPMQAIVASTASGAKFLQAEDLGTLEQGKWADLIVLDANPLAEIRNSRTIHAVYIAGQSVPSIER